MAKVRLDQVTKRYENGHIAVADVSFSVEDGEFVVLVGPSGCGKSTTLRMVAGLERITEGTLWIGDRRMNEVSPKDRDLAMVFQNYALYPHMTVYENMAFGLKLRKYARDEIETRVRGAAEVLGISGILDRKPKQLSGGQRQRVAVGRAIVRKPQVFLFDEPLSNLDAQLRVQMRAEIAKLHRRLEATMLYVTHDQVEAMTMGDRIVVLKEGRIQQVDTPMRLYREPVNRFVAGFIGSPSMNFIEGRVVQEGGGLRFRSHDGAVSFVLGEEAADRLQGEAHAALTLGVRPEDIYVAGRAQKVAATEPVRLEVEVLEPMGNETFLYVRRAEGTLVARVAPQPLPGPGESVALVFDAHRLHFFDAAGAALGRAEQVAA